MSLFFHPRHLLVLFLAIFGLAATAANIVEHKKYLYDEHHTRFQLIKSVPGNKPMNWFFLPGGPGADSAYLQGLVDSTDVPGNYWLIDLPGNGTNSAPISPDMLQQWGDFLVDALKGFENPVLVGHSFGGYLPLFCPKLEGVLKGLVILNSVPRFDLDIFAKTVREHHLPSLEAAQALFVEKQTLETLQALYLLESVYFFSPANRQLGIDQILNKLVFSIPVEHWWYTQGSLFYNKITWVPQKTPTLVIGGSDDYITPLDVFKTDDRFKRENIQMLVIENAGHFPWLEQPQALNQALKNFADELRCW